MPIQNGQGLRRFFQRHTDGQQVCGEVLSITAEGKADGNHSELSPLTCKDGERRPCTLLVGMQAGIAVAENSRAVPQKIKPELPYDPAVPCFGVCTEGRNSVASVAQR